MTPVTRSTHGFDAGASVSAKRVVAVMMLPAVLLTTILLVFMASCGGTPDEKGLRTALPYLLAVNHAIVLSLLVWILRREGRSLRDIGWSVDGGVSVMREIALGLLAGLAFYLFKELVFDSLQALAAGNRRTFTTLFRMGLETSELPMLVVATGFVFIEERVYRGYGLPPLVASWGRGAGLLVMAVLFGLLHWGNGLTAIAYTAVLGLGFGLLFLWRRTLWSPTIAHALYNALIVLT